MDVLSFAEAATPRELRVQVLAAHFEAWPGDDGAPLADDALLHDPALAPLSMVLVDDGVVLAALDILTTSIDHAGQRYRAGGLSSVATAIRHRGRGYGGQLVKAAHAQMAASKLDLGIFTCDRPLHAFYEQSGWHLLAGTVLIGGTPSEPFRSDQRGFDKVTMADFFTARAQAHAADFTNTAIELYPGNVDKLW